MKVRFTLSIGFLSAKRSEVVEYDEDVTDEELDADWLEWTNNFIDGGPERLEK